MDILDGWVMDMPQQFHGKERIGILISAFAEQLEKLYEVFRQLDLVTDLGTATGRNLDMVGDILTLTRKEAGELAGIGMSEPVLPDARYDQILKYRILRNTSDCTYYDIMAGLEYLYNFRFNYQESPNYPATVILNMPVELDQPDLAFYRNLCIKPSGVRILVEKKFSTAFLWDMKYEARLDLISEFYPRYNVPPLRLDGKASLDGQYLLNGYQDGGQVDFYPVSMGIAQSIQMPYSWSGGIGVSAAVEVPAKVRADLAITGGVANHAEAMGGIQVSGGASVLLRCGGHLVVEQDLAYLDGDRTLDGHWPLGAGGIEVDLD